jgi:hypothetical protein
MSDINVPNFDTAFKVAFAGFFRLGELVYTAAEMQNALTFQNTKITRQDVRFFEKGQYATILLKRSKTDYDHRGVTIVLTASHDSVCPVAVLHRRAAVSHGKRSPARVCPAFSAHKRRLHTRRIHQRIRKQAPD